MNSVAITVAVIGAAGAVGTRITGRLQGDPDYRLLYVEGNEAAQTKLRQRGVTPTEGVRAVAQADMVVLAVPDTLIGKVAAQLVPHLRSGAMLVCLDPAAPYAGRLPDRPDVTYFVTHPAHPPVFNDETTPEARRDYWGGGHAKQAIVNALMQGPEEDYARGEALSKAMFGPILRSHRVSLAQMALLEPALSETVTLTCLATIREAFDEVVRQGVPAEATRDFLLGHIGVELAILFDELDWRVSAGAQKALEEAQRDILQPDWKKVLTPEALRSSVLKIVGDDYGDD